MRSGFLSIVGRPNVGKSTLLNSILDYKIAITSNKAQTTRNIIQGIYNEPDTQIIFLDTPGIHKPQSKLGKILNKESYSVMKDVDAILFVVDAKGGFGAGDKMILESLKKTNSPVFLILNKIDQMTEDEILCAIASYKDIFPFNLSHVPKFNIVFGFVLDCVMYVVPIGNTNSIKPCCIAFKFVSFVGVILFPKLKYPIISSIQKKGRN